MNPNYSTTILCYWLTTWYVYVSGVDPNTFLIGLCRWTVPICVNPTQFKRSQSTQIWVKIWGLWNVLLWIMLDITGTERPDTTCLSRLHVLLWIKLDITGTERLDTTCLSKLTSWYCKLSQLPLWQTAFFNYTRITSRNGKMAADTIFWIQLLKFCNYVKKCEQEGPFYRIAFWGHLAHLMPWCIPLSRIDAGGHNPPFVPPKTVSFGVSDCCTGRVMPRHIWGVHSGDYGTCAVVHMACGSGRR